MTTFFDRVKKGVEAAREALGPGGYTLKGKRIVCPHCSHDTFHPGSALLNSRTRTLFDVDWADRGATTLACANCGRIEWFIKGPDRLE